MAAAGIRQRAILEQLRMARFATVGQLSAALGVSEVTVRRHLQRLEDQGLVTRTRGGAVLVSGPLEEPGLSAKQRLQAEEKRRIAAAAAAMVEDGEAIALNAGTTTAAVARALAGRRGLTVVTNSLPVVAALASAADATLVVVGGQLRARSLALVGPLAVQSLEELRVSKVFLGVNGLSVEHGLTTPNLEEAMVNRAMLRAAERVVVVADHTKFGRVAFSRIAAIEDVHVVITDAAAPPDAVAALRERGCQVILA